MTTNSFKSVFAIIPIGNHVRVGVNTVQTLTAPAGANILLLEAEAQSVRFRLDGVDPTEDIGFLLETTDNMMRLDLFNGASVKVIGTDTGGFLNYQWAVQNR